MSTETPVKVGEGFVAVAAGQHHSVGIKENGELWGWGDTGRRPGDRQNPPL